MPGTSQKLNTQRGVGSCPEGIESPGEESDVSTNECKSCYTLPSESVQDAETGVSLTP